MIDVVLPKRLPDSSAAWDLARALGDAALLRWPRYQRARVRVHSNRQTLIKWGHRAGVLRLDVHVAFLGHPDDILAVVADRDPHAWKRLLALPREASAPSLSSEGRVHHLPTLWAAEQTRIDTQLDATYGWGRWPGTAPRRGLRLGSCQQGPPAVIRIHPVLDHGEVPDWFVGFVLFHELLHLRYPPLSEGKRRIVHPRSFRQAERRHPRFAEAEAWEQTNVSGLLRRVGRHVAGREA